MKPLKNYLLENDNQSLLGSVIQYGYNFADLDKAAKEGIIEVRDSMVYLVQDNVKHSI